MSQTTYGNRNGGMRERMADWQPWVALMAGGALAGWGIVRALRDRPVTGSAIAGAGAFLIYRGATAERAWRPVHVEAAFTINKPIQEVYQFWRNFENFPRFMSHLESVVVTGDRWSHWVARGPLKTTISWRAEITDERPNEYLVWRSKPDSMIEQSGSVQFRQAPGNRGTEVIVALDYQPPAGAVGDTFAKMLGHSPEQKIREDLRHMKQLLEAGEIPTTEGQSAGRRSLIGKIAHLATREPRRHGIERVERRPQAETLPA